MCPWIKFFQVTVKPCIPFVIIYQEFVLCADIETELNQMPGRPLREKVVISNTLCSDNLPTITTVPDIADHPLGNTLLAIFKIWIFIILE